MKYADRLYRAYVFDLDGTIYLGDHLLPGALRMLAELRRRGIPVRFLSNNPTKDPQMYLKKLTSLGIEADLGQIANTVVTTVSWIKANYPQAAVFPIAEEPLCRALREAGIKITDDPRQTDIVIASYDRTFDYRKLQIAFDAIWFYRRAFLIQTNPDRFCPFPGGRGEPDCAAVTAAIEACTGTKVKVNLGKPSAVMLDEALRGLDVPREECVMVGDRLQTDIQMALDLNLVSTLVLTGEAGINDVAALPENNKPNYVFDRVDRLIPKEIWDELGWTENDE